MTVTTTATPSATLDCIIQAALGPHEFVTEYDAPEKARAMFASGVPGLILFLSEVALSREDETIAEHCVQLLEDNIDTIFGQLTRTGLFSGLAGVGFAVEHLQVLGLLDDVAPITEPILEVCGTAVENDTALPFELGFGVIGVGIFGLEHYLATGDATLVESAVESLHRRAKFEDGVCTWIKAPNPRWLGLKLAEEFPNGLLDTGLAHGTAGAIALCAASVEAGIRTDQASELLRGAVEWFRRNERPEDRRRWPAIVDSNRVGFGWCRGDVGIAAALIAAAGALRDDSSATWARDCALEALETDQGDGLSLCHGAAGIAVIAQSAYAATGDEAFRNHAESAIAHVTDAIASGESFESEGFLVGRAGVGLALHMSLHPDANGWTRALVPGLTTHHR